MKLIRLKITDKVRFRSLDFDFEIKFHNQWDSSFARVFEPYCFAGNNGSGKSNVLEALAAIFFHLDCCFNRDLPDGFIFDEMNNHRGFRSSKCNPDAFELEYLFPIPEESISQKDVSKDKIGHIKVVKELDSEPTFTWVNSIDFTDFDQLILISIEAEKFLPKKVIGYSSGENEILSLPFFKMKFLQYDEYLDKLKKDDFYGQTPNGRLIYIDNQLNQAVLLSILLLENPDNFQIWEDKIGLQGVNEFRIIIAHNHYENIDEDTFLSLKKDERKSHMNTTIELTTKLKPTIDKFKYCASTYGTVYLYPDGEIEPKEYLYLDFKVNDSTKKAFKSYFYSPLELFEAFQILFTLNSYIINEATRKRVYRSKNIYLNKEELPVPFDEERITRFKNFELSIKDVNEIVYTKSLSDGEHQLIHALGISLLYKDYPCLFLFDEPETHFNQQWRSEFMSIIRSSLNKGKAKNQLRDMLITTHSAYLISDTIESNVLIFKKVNGVATCSRPKFNTFGASINKISIEAFGSPITIGKHALSIMEEINTRFEGGENRETLIFELENRLGDSVEKTFLMHKIEK